MTMPAFLYLIIVYSIYNSFADRLHPIQLLLFAWYHFSIRSAIFLIPFYARLHKWIQSAEHTADCTGHFKEIHHLTKRIRRNFRQGNHNIRCTIFQMGCFHALPHHPVHLMQCFGMVCDTFRQHNIIGDIFNNHRCFKKVLPSVLQKIDPGNAGR